MRGLVAQFPPASLQTPEVRNSPARPPLILLSLTIPIACDSGPEADDPARTCWTAEGGRKSHRFPCMWLLILCKRCEHGGRWRRKRDEPDDHSNLKACWLCIVAGDGMCINELLLCQIWLQCRRLVRTTRILDLHTSTISTRIVKQDSI